LLGAADRAPGQSRDPAGIDEIISHASETMTLELGDLIRTGTPAGVGVFRDPQRLLQPGDEVTVEVGSVGSLTDPVAAG
jgi:2-keto-4-pentenoate hydratase/2-oxohepta-3-ene-1,7-dioic acid hydratase in catechol pathway